MKYWLTCLISPLSNFLEISLPFSYFWKILWPYWQSQVEERSLTREEIDGKIFCIKLRRSRQAPEKLNLHFSSSLCLPFSTAEKLSQLKRWKQRYKKPRRGWSEHLFPLCFFRSGVFCCAVSPVFFWMSLFQNRIKFLTVATGDSNLFHWCVFIGKVAVNTIFNNYKSVKRVIFIINFVVKMEGEKEYYWSIASGLYIKYSTVSTSSVYL